MNGILDQRATESARKALRQGRPDKAAAILDALLASETDLGEVVPLLAQTLRDSARDERFLASASAALAIDPVDCGSHDQLDYRFRRRIGSDEVFQEIAQIAFSRPEASLCYLAVIDDLIAMGRLAEAESWLRKVSPPNDRHGGGALQILADHVGVWHYLRGRIALAKGEQEQALTALTAAILADRQLYSARVLAGQICRELGMGAKACSFYDLADPMLSAYVYTGW
jgi:tetratricopeptide (TPR) repeat protein